MNIRTERSSTYVLIAKGQAEEFCQFASQDWHQVLARDGKYADTTIALVALKNLPVFTLNDIARFLRNEQYDWMQIHMSTLKPTFMFACDGLYWTGTVDPNCLIDWQLNSICK